jgi:hypothetical protein
VQVAGLLAWPCGGQMVAWQWLSVARMPARCEYARTISAIATIIDAGLTPSLVYTEDSLVGELETTRVAYEGESQRKLRRT